MSRRSPGPLIDVQQPGCKAVAEAGLRVPIATQAYLSPITPQLFFGGLGWFSVSDFSGPPLAVNHNKTPNHGCGEKSFHHD